MPLGIRGLRFGEDSHHKLLILVLTKGHGGGLGRKENRKHSRPDCCPSKGWLTRLALVSGDLDFGRIPTINC